MCAEWDNVLVVRVAKYAYTDAYLAVSFLSRCFFFICALRRKVRTPAHSVVYCTRNGKTKIIEDIAKSNSCIECNFP